jgi:chitin synthase
VVYNAKGFLEKNRDNLSMNLVDCMKSSSIELVVELFAAERTMSGSISRSNSNIIAKPYVPPVRPKSSEIKRIRQSLTQKKAKSLKKKIQTLKISTMLKDKMNQVTVASHFRVITKKI